jgi:ribosomal protein S18 acetylase RimI-like enzyme
MKQYIEQTSGWDDGLQRAWFDENLGLRWSKIIVVTGDDAGMLLVRKLEDTVQIARIQLMPAFQGRGIGSTVVRDVLDMARADGKSAALDVLKVNPARRLYERLGFGKIGQTETHVLMQAR